MACSMDDCNSAVLLSVRDWHLRGSSLEDVRMRINGYPPSHRPSYVYLSDDLAISMQRFSYIHETI